LINGRRTVSAAGDRVVTVISGVIGGMLSLA